MSSPFCFSALARQLRPSPIRELFKLIAQPGMISFAGGLSDPALFPVEQFASCADVLRSSGREVLQYGASEGYGPLRSVLLERMTDQLGYGVKPDELVITSGSQQAVDLIGRVLLDPGDVVVVEAPTYPGTLHSLRGVGARFAAVSCDGEGMCVELLPEVVERCEQETGRRPKLIYTVPDFANPSGACLSRSRRERLLEIAAELGVPILEDDPYGRLRFAGDPLPTLKSLAGGAATVIYASSFSKILAPGVRVAWTVGGPELVRAMVLVRQGADLCTSTVTQALVAEYCRRGLVDDHVARMAASYGAKCAAMQDSLAEHVLTGAASWRQPEGGFFFWLGLHGQDGEHVFRRAVEEKVAFVPGAAFYPEPEEQVGVVVDGREHARLCFSFAGLETIEEGCRRLARAIS